MRDIKFRAWDKDAKAWVNEPPMFYMQNHEPFASTLHVHEELGTELMQYTGLKDKNGVEIYEGDILHYYKENIDPWRNDNSKDYTDDKIGFVEYLADESHIGGRYEVWYKDWEGKERGYSEWIYAKYSEVIGNIYENKDLLK